jgi:hypothetical protein
MMRRAICLSIILGLLATTSAIAGSNTSVYYDVTDLGLGRWQYTYEVSNISFPEPIEEFTIWFGIGSYDNLVIETQNPPSNNWNELVWNPEPVLGDDGGYDALATGLNIGIGESVAGFSVSFDWLGTGSPGSQFYEIINPTTFETIESSYTVPEPATLLFLGLGGLALFGRKRNRRTSFLGG